MANVTVTPGTSNHGSTVTSLQVSTTAPTNGQGFFIVATYYSAAQTPTCDNGMTLVFNHNEGNNNNIALFAKVAGASDTGVYNLGFPAAVYVSAQPIVLPASTYDLSASALAAVAVQFNGFSSTQSVNTGPSFAPPSESAAFAAFCSSNTTGVVSGLAANWVEDAHITLSEESEFQHYNVTVTTGQQATLTFSAAAYGTSAIWYFKLLAPQNPIVANPTSLSFANPGVAPKTVTLSETAFAGTWSITGAPTASIATASISGSTVTVTAVGPGSTSVTVSDGTQSLAIPISIDGYISYIISGTNQTILTFNKVLASGSNYTGAWTATSSSGGTILTVTPTSFTGANYAITLGYGGNTGADTITVTNTGDGDSLALPYLVGVPAATGTVAYTFAHFGQIISHRGR